MNRARVSASKASQAATQTTSSAPPKITAASRTPSGRQVCGSGRRAAQSRQAWMSVSRMPRAPMSNSSSISRWAPTPRHHRADGDPALAMQRRARSGSRCRASAPPPRRRSVARGCRSPSSRSCGRPGRPRAAAGTPRARPGPSPPRVTSTASDSRMRLAERLQPGRAQGAAGLDDVGDHVGDAELDAGLDRAVEPGHGGVDAALLEERADHADVRRGDPLAGQVGEVGVPARRDRRSGTGCARSRAPCTSSALAPESSSRSRPVMPTSSVPSPTYSAMSRGRR